MGSGVWWIMWSSIGESGNCSAKWASLTVNPAAGSSLVIGILRGGRGRVSPGGSGGGPAVRRVTLEPGPQVAGDEGPGRGGRRVVADGAGPRQGAHDIGQHGAQRPVAGVDHRDVEVGVGRADRVFVTGVGR